LFEFQAPGGARCAGKHANWRAMGKAGGW